MITFDCTFIDEIMSVNLTFLVITLIILFKIMIIDHFDF